MPLTFPTVTSLEINMENTVLITGFDPFGGESINPSWEAVKLLPAQLENAQIISKEIPTSFEKAPLLLKEYIQEYKPNMVICVGQAGGRPSVTIERVAINIQDASIPDNNNYQPNDVPVIPAGPDAYLSNLPIKEMVSAVNNAGFPCFISNSAGTYVCNTLMYTALHELNKLDNESKSRQKRQAGFIHVPFTCEQVIHQGKNYPSMKLEDISTCLKAAIIKAINLY